MYSSVPVGGIAVALMLGTYALLGLPPSGPLLVLASCGAFLVYGLDRSLLAGPEDAFNQPERVAWVRRHATWVRTSALLAAALALSVLPFLRPTTLVAGALLGLPGVLYAVPLLPGGRRPKSIWLLKPVLIAAAWSVGATVLPALEAGVPLTSSVGALVGYRFLFILPNALLADWPDRAGDRQAGLRTVATELSPKALRRLAAAPLVLALAGGLVVLWFVEAPRLLYVDLAGPALLLGCVLRLPADSRWFYGFTLDAVVAWPALTALADLALGS